MAKIAKQLTELIGHTPLLELTNYEKALGLEAKIIAKLEYFNPLGSVKDRVAAANAVYPSCCAGYQGWCRSDKR